MTTYDEIYDLEPSYTELLLIELEEARHVQEA